MLDFRQETRAEMVGLHLDLVRMGRTWRRELSTTMQEYVGDLKELREENREEDIEAPPALVASWWAGTKIESVGFVSSWLYVVAMYCVLFESRRYDYERRC